MKLRKCFRCGKTHECVNRVAKSTRPQLRQRKDRTWSRDRNGHTYEYLVGFLDHVKRRIEIYKRAGGDAVLFDEAQPEMVEDLKSATCQGCPEPHLVGFNEGEWFHNSKTKGGRRCDCVECSLFTCKPFHIRYHNRVIAVRQVEL